MKFKMSTSGDKISSLTDNWSRANQQEGENTQV